MPTALYTISHKATRRVLAFASVERKPTLTDDVATWEAFCTELVGEDMLALPTFGHPKIEIPVEQLAVDQVETDAVTARLLYDDPYQYEIVSSQAAPEPGDGKKKEIITPQNIATPALVAPHTLTITLANPPTEPVPVTVLFEGEAPKSVTIVAPNKTATFTVAANLVATHRYLVLAMATGSPTFSGLVEST